MAMPAELVMVRHGESEANYLRHLRETNPEAVPPEFYERHDSDMRLSPKGREQARAAGQWLLQNFPEGFDRYYTSTLIRTLETAGRLAISDDWIQDDSWRERDWGEFGMLTEEEQAELYKHNQRLMEMNRWYWVPAGGESLATGVRGRWQKIEGTLNRKLDGKRVIAVTHGETMSVARFGLEHMTPVEWLAEYENEDRDIKNCQILDYTRIHPITGEMAPQLSWFRSICPWDESNSWEGGNWIPISPRPRYSSAQLLNIVERTPLLMPEELHA